MLTIRLFFEWSSHFLWILDGGVPFINPSISSNGYFVESGWDGKKDNPACSRYYEERLQGQRHLEEVFDYLDNKYQTLFVNNKIEFSYKGFDSKEERLAFLKTFQEFYEEFYELLKDKYEIINDVTSEYFE